MRTFLQIPLCAICLFALSTFAQDSEPFSRNAGSGNWAQNLRVTSQSSDHLEAWLVLDKWYDGSVGPTALLDAVILKKGNKESSKWFTCKKQIIGTGGGTVTLKVRFNPSKDGAPASVTTDQIQIRFLNSSGRTLVTSVPFSRTIRWGEDSGRINERVDTKPREEKK
ncbi:MAG: hypothetical protein ACTHMT_06895 [Verrucomicrobiota bacterium]